MVLRDAMEEFGFVVNRYEYWHFDMGTQKAFMERTLRGLPTKPYARYGRYDLVT